MAAPASNGNTPWLSNAFPTSDDTHAPISHQPQAKTPPDITPDAHSQSQTPEELYEFLLLLMQMAQTQAAVLASSEAKPSTAITVSARDGDWGRFQAKDAIQEYLEDAEFNPNSKEEFRIGYLEECMEVVRCRLRERGVGYGMGAVSEGCGRLGCCVVRVQQEGTAEGGGEGQGRMGRNDGAVVSFGVLDDI